MFRLIGYLFGMGAVLFFVVALGVAWYVGDVTRDLPDYEVLSTYEPPVTTRIHAADGALMAEHARERRLYIPIQAVPDRVKAAFLSAEDKNFYQHNGLDYTGLVSRGHHQCRELLLRQASCWSIDNHAAGRKELPAELRTHR